MSMDVSVRLAAARGGDPDAFAQAYEAAYDELRRLARRQLRSLRPGDTLATTALVNEAFLKLVPSQADCCGRTFSLDGGRLRTGLSPCSARLVE
jgi:DNA-directed RNA polymerase specialized sigma24 family protein